MTRVFIFVFTLFSISAFSQKFTIQDTLRGSVTPERAWWDLTFYHLDIEVHPDEKFISGKNTVRYTVLEPHQKLQIDLQEPLNLKIVTQDEERLTVESIGNAHFITLKKEQIPGASEEIVVHYS